MCLEHVVPVVQSGTEAFDGGMEADHAAGHVFPGGVGVETTVDLIALGNESAKPTGVCSGAGGGDAKLIGEKGEATERIDGRFAQHDGGGLRSKGAKIAVIFP